MKKRQVKNRNQMSQIYGINGCFNVLNHNKINIIKIELMIGGIAERKTWVANIVKTKKYIISRLQKEQYLKKFSGKRTQGIVVIFKNNIIKEIPSDIASKINNCLLVIDNLEDPQNLGQIIRTAECANITGLLLPEHQSVQLTDSVLQVSQGAFMHIPIYKCGNLHQQLKALKKEGFWIIGVENSIKAMSWYEFDYKRKIVIVMGSEGKGIRPIILKICDDLVTIPMEGKLNSLNVSSATAAILFERFRQLSS